MSQGYGCQTPCASATDTGVACLFGSHLENPYLFRFLNFFTVKPFWNFAIFKCMLQKVSPHLSLPS